jgi:hypothetical protein
MPVTEVHTHTEAAHEPEVFDAEIRIRPLVVTMVWVFGVTIVSAILVWLMLIGFQKLDQHGAVAPLPVEKANPQGLPPEPRLEGTPTANIDVLHKEEEELLNHPGWVDRQQGIVRLPIERALEVAAEKGLPGPGAAPAPTAPEATTTPAGASPPTAAVPPPAPVSAPGAATPAASATPATPPPATGAHR